jgi:hypothetical protein
MALLTAKDTYFRNGHAMDASFVQGIFNVIDFGRLNDCGNQFHFLLSLLVVEFEDG